MNDSDDLDERVAAKVRSSFAAQSMMGSIGAELVSVAHGIVTITAPVHEGFRQQQDVAHGGLVFTIGDSAAGYAALSTMPLDVEVMTVEMKINLLSPASERLVAEGRVIKPGRRLIVVAADIWDERSNGDRKLVAAMQGTMIPVGL